MIQRIRDWMHERHIAALRRDYLQLCEHGEIAAALEACRAVWRAEDQRSPQQRARMQSDEAGA